MPIMLRTSSKASKILYSLIGKPPALVPPKKNKSEQKINDRLKADFNNNLKS